MRAKFLVLGMLAAASLSLAPANASAQRVTIRDGRYHVDFTDRYDRAEERRVAAAERAARTAERAVSRALARSTMRLENSRYEFEARAASRERIRERAFEARERARQARYFRPVVYYRRRW